MTLKHMTFACGTVRSARWCRTWAKYRLPTRNDCVLDPFMSVVLAAPSLPARLALVIDLLCRGITVSLPKRWDAAPQALRAWARLRRLLARFAALVAAVEAGRVPVARTRAGAVSRPRPPAATTRLPAGSGWLLSLAPAIETRVGRAQLKSLLGEPELASLLLAAPQAGRLLRPLCHMLRIELPPALLLPRLPRAERPGLSGSTDIQATAGEVPQARVARPPLPWWLIRPPSPPLPMADEAPPDAMPDPARTGPPGG